MPDDMKIEDGVWKGEDGGWVLPAMIRAPGSNGHLYFAPLAVDAIKGGETLIFDARRIRAALRTIKKQMKEQGATEARPPKKARRNRRVVQLKEVHSG
jgi:hypothetical protein